MNDTLDRLPPASSATPFIGAIVYLHGDPYRVTAIADNGVDVTVEPVPPPMRLRPNRHNRRAARARARKGAR